MSTGQRHGYNKFLVLDRNLDYPALARWPTYFAMLQPPPPDDFANLWFGVLRTCATILRTCVLRTCELAQLFCELVFCELVNLCLGFAQLFCELVFCELANLRTCVWGFANLRTCVWGFANLRTCVWGFAQLFCELVFGVLRTCATILRTCVLHFSLRKNLHLQLSFVFVVIASTYISLCAKTYICSYLSCLW
jgi:hypothetical protein